MSLICRNDTKSSFISYTFPCSSLLQSPCFRVWFPSLVTKPQRFAERSRSLNHQRNGDISLSIMRHLLSLLFVWGMRGFDIIQVFSYQRDTSSVLCFWNRLGEGREKAGGELVEISTSFSGISRLTGWRRVGGRFGCSLFDIESVLNIIHPQRGIRVHRSVESYRGRESGEGSH